MSREVIGPTPAIEGRRDQADALAWIATDNWEWPYSFRRGMRA